MELGCVGDEEDVAVYVDRRPYRPEEEGEDVARFMGRDEDRRAKIVHLEKTKMADMYFMRLTKQVQSKETLMAYMSFLYHAS